MRTGAERNHDYRDPDRGPCPLWPEEEANWEDRVVDEITFYRSRLEAV
jgi:hypothetical protein